jgi:hypothetical protein
MRTRQVYSPPCVHRFGAPHVATQTLRAASLLARALRVHPSSAECGLRSDPHPRDDRIAHPRDPRRVSESRSGLIDVIKFHGDFDEKDSLVLTESNYFDRLEFEGPLDILLRADALNRPILFVGYSLSDMNMRYLFHKLWKVWEKARVSDARKKSYIYLAAPNPVEEEIYRKWGIMPIVDEVGGSRGLIEFLKAIKK